MKLSYWITKTFTSALLVFTLSPAWSQATRSRFQAQHVPLSVSAGRADVISPADPSTSIGLYVSLPLRNEPELDNLLSQLQDPTSPAYRHYLNKEDFTTRFGPSLNDYERVAAWARGKGFTIGDAPLNRRFVQITGSIRQIDEAFGVAITNYRDHDSHEVFYAPDREPTIDLAVPVLAISGLDSATPPRSNIRKGSTVGGVSSGGTWSATGSGPSGTFTPSDMRAAYYGAGSLTGAGQTVAIFSYAPYSPTDLQLYYNKVGMSTNVPVRAVSVNGFNPICPSTCNDAEQVLDIANVIGMAPGLSQVLFYAGSSSTAVLNQMATDTNKPLVISNSWYNGDFGKASDPIFQQFQAQGQTFLSASGDFGNYNNSGYGPPELDPYITQVGGTTLSVSGGAWASEIAWSLGSNACPGNGSAGGWLANTYPIPYFQQAPGVINSANGGSTVWRNSPDIAAEGACDNSYVTNGAFFTGAGGTSYSAPRWAGLIALANQQVSLNGANFVGFLAPSVYAIGTGPNYHADFHDITVGNNGKGSGPFTAVAGYDLVTGWGSPVGNTLISKLSESPPPPPPPPTSWNINSIVTNYYGSGGTTYFTVTTGSPNTLSPGSQIVISGTSFQQFNQYWTVGYTMGQSSFSVMCSSCTTASGSGGTVALR